MPDTFHTLLTSLTSRTCVPFVGAGVSIAPPTNALDWNSFIKHIITALATHSKPIGYTHSTYQRVLDSVVSYAGKPELVLQVLHDKSTLSDDNFFRLLRSLESLKPNFNHYALAQMAANKSLQYIVTTNFDTCIEQALTDLSIKYKSYVDHEGAAELAYRVRNDKHEGLVHVLKLHGTIKDKSSIVMTLNEAALPLSTDHHTVIRTIAEKFSFLFVGYSGRDDDIAPLLYSLADVSPGLFWSVYDENAKTTYSDWIVNNYGLKGQYVNAQGQSILCKLATAIDSNADFRTNLLDSSQTAPPEHDTILAGWSQLLSTDLSGDLLAEVLLAIRQFDTSEQVGRELLKRAQEQHASRNSADSLIRLCERYLHIGKSLFDKSQAAIDQSFANQAYNFADWTLTVLEMIRDGDSYYPEVQSLEPEARTVVLHKMQPQLSEMYLLMGQLYLAISAFDDAAGFFQAAHFTSFYADKITGLATSLIGWASALRQGGKPDEARRHIVNALYLSYAEGDLPTQAEAMLELARSNRESLTDDLDLATAFATEAEVIFTNLGNKARAGDALECRKALMSKVGGSDRTERAHGRITSWLATQEPGEVVDIVESAAVNRIDLAQLGDGFNRLIKDVDFLARLFHLKGDTDKASEVQLQLCAYCLSYGRPYRAILRLREHEHSCSDNRTLYDIYSMLADAYNRIGNTDESSRYIKLAQNVTERLHDPKQTTAVLREHGKTLLESKDYTGAREVLNRALERALASKDHIECVTIIHHLGLVSHREGKFDEAERRYLEAYNMQEGSMRSLTKERGYSYSPVLKAATAASLGMLYAKWEKYELSLPLLVEGYHRYQLLNSSDIRTIYYWLNKVEEHFGNEEYSRRIHKIESTIKLQIKNGELP